MALIPCPECKKEISDQAEHCVGCGFPLKRRNPFGLVCITTPRDATTASFPTNPPRQIVILGSSSRTLWEGRYGEVAHFIPGSVQKICVLLADQKYPLDFLVKPGRTYELTYLPKEHTYTLNELGSGAVPH